MNNPFLMALKTNPKQFFGDMSTEELIALTNGAVETLVAKAEKGDRPAMLALLQVSRVIGAVEI